MCLGRGGARNPQEQFCASPRAHWQKDNWDSFTRGESDLNISRGRATLNNKKKTPNKIDFYLHTRYNSHLTILVRNNFNLEQFNFFIRHSSLYDDKALKTTQKIYKAKKHKATREMFTRWTYKTFQNK